MCLLQPSSKLDRIYQHQYCRSTPKNWDRKADGRRLVHSQHSRNASLRHQEPTRPVPHAASVGRRHCFTPLRRDSLHPALFRLFFWLGILGSMFARFSPSSTTLALTTSPFRLTRCTSIQPRFTDPRRKRLEHTGAGTRHRKWNLPALTFDLG